MTETTLLPTLASLNAMLDAADAAYYDLFDRLAARLNAPAPA